MPSLLIILDPVQQGFLHTVYRWGLEGLGNLFELTKLVAGRARIQIFSFPYFMSSYYLLSTLPHCISAEVSKLWSTGHTGPLPVAVNMLPLTHQCLWMLLCSKARRSGCDKDCVTYNIWRFSSFCITAPMPGPRAPQILICIQNAWRSCDVQILVPQVWEGVRVCCPHGCSLGPALSRMEVVIHGVTGTQLSTCLSFSGLEA